MSKSKLVRVISLISLLTLVSCSGIPAKRVYVVNQPSKGVKVTRADKFFNCLVELSREGLKQSLLKPLCEATFGSIE